MSISMDHRSNSKCCYAEFYFFDSYPFLCAKLAQAVVIGCQSQGVAVVAKHFCAQGETTGGVNASAARIGEHELREIHLPPIQACCEAGVEGVMAAHNEIDGLPRVMPIHSCCVGHCVMNWGFTGLVMADGTADRLDILTGVAASSGALALRSGVYSLCRLNKW
jgi:beta-glucosidase